GGGFLCHRQRAVAATGEGVAVVELGGVDAGADGEVGDHLAVVGAHDDQFLRVAAADEQAAVLGVDGHADRRAAGGDGPVIENVPLLGVDDGDLALVLEVDVGLAGAVGGEELGLAAEVDLVIRFAGLGIDVGGDRDEAAGVAADDEDLLAGRVVNDAVGVGVGLDLAEHFVGVGVEDRHVAGLAVGDEAAVLVGDDGDA